MSRLGVVKVVGNSGTQYRFLAYPLTTVFRKGRSVVYLTTCRRTRQDAPSKHRRIGLGQTDDVRRLLTDQGKSLAAGGANCICVCGEPDSRTRLAIQRDLGGT